MSNEIFEMQGARSWKSEVELSNLPVVEERLKVANKKAKRLGIPALVLTRLPAERLVIKWYHQLAETSEIFDAEKGYPENAQKIRHFVSLVITGVPPILGGWDLLARLDILGSGEEANLVVSPSPDAGEISGSMIRQDTTCDHCGHRRHRKTCYLLRKSDSGDLVQVGSKCLHDFLPFGNDPAKILAFWTSVGNLCDEGEFWGCATERDLDLDRYLGFVALLIREEGWLSRSAARNAWDRPGAVATCDDANDEMQRPYSHGKHFFAPRWEGGPTAEDKAVAQEAIAWAAALPLDGSSFEVSIRAIARSRSCPKKLIGFAAAIVSSYQRHTENLKKQELAESIFAGRDKNAVAGMAGERKEFKARYLFSRRFEGSFGPTYLLTFIDLATGATIISFASEGIWDKFSKPEAGTEVSFKATIKGYKDYKDIRQTQVARITWA